MDITTRNLEQEQFSFNEVKMEKIIFEESKFRQKMEQWNMDKHTVLCRFRMSKKMDNQDCPKFFEDFFMNSSVCKSLGLKVAPNHVNVKYQQLSTEVLSLDFFDRLYDGKVASCNGYIRRCMDEMYSGVNVSDYLRDMFVNEDSENQTLFTEKEKLEFIYHILWRFAVGGSLCQPDDTLNDYVECTKNCYKSLLTIQRSNKTEKPMISSSVYKIDQVQSCGDSLLFPNDSPHGFCYLIVDVSKRLVTCWYSPFVSMW